MKNTQSDNFIYKMVAEDLASSKSSEVITRFPPEPNGYLHIGHTKAIILNFGLAEHFGGKCNLRFDDTNPLKESEEYVKSMKQDIEWLGFSWGKLCYASDYFEQLFEWAIELIKAKKAYVDSLSAGEMKDYRGTLTEPGRESPYRSRSVEENLELFKRMRAGEFKEGEHVLRAKIDMTSGNLNLRDPVMYRIINAPHQRTGDAWHIYPTYDWAHGQSDAIEGVTHSLCTIEFAHHKPLYEWFLDELNIKRPRPYQTEFAPTSLTYTLLSKRFLKLLIDHEHVQGWDDPRLLTIAGMRRRGYTPRAICAFIEDIGVDRNESTIEIERFEYFVRQDLNKVAQRVMAVLEPLKVVITNYPADLTEELEAINNPENAGAGTRKVPFSQEIYIERNDFLENPPKKFFRLTLEREVRLMHAYYITCNEVIKDQNGNIVELRCTYDPETKGGDSPDGRKVKGTLHWVSVKHALNAEVRFYEHLFNRANPKHDLTENLIADINPDSLKVIEGVKLEPHIKTMPQNTNYQFLRQGYFFKDIDSTPEKLILNRTIGLRDTWAKLLKKKD